MTEENWTNRDSEPKTQICPMRKTAQDDLEGTTGQIEARSSIVEGKQPAKSGKKRGRGRPRATFTAEQLRKIDAMAEAQCKDTTIALAIGVPVETFRQNLRERTEQKRAIGKVTVMLAQYEGCKVKGTGGMSERTFWGKQHLGQSDKQGIEHSGSIETGREPTEAEWEAFWAKHKAGKV